MRPSLAAGVIVVIMSVATGFVDLRARAYPQRPYTEFIPRVVDGSADAPERYRVLVPFGLHGLAKVTGLSPSTVWHLSRLTLFVAAYFIFLAYLRTWFSEPSALLGTAVVAATLPLTFTNSWAHPDHAAELGLFTAACLAIARNRTAWVFGLLALATLNRETAAFLVPLYLVVGPTTRQRLLVTGALALEWAAIYVGLRAWRGFAAYDYLQIWRNLEFLQLLPSPYDPYYRAYAWFGILLFGGLIFVALQGSGSARPEFATRALLVTPLLAAVAFVISSIIETRILTPLYPLVLPAVISACTGADSLQKSCETP
jgi:hypothetical protein